MNRILLIVCVLVLNKAFVMGMSQDVQEISIIIPYSKPDKSDSYLCAGTMIESPGSLYIVGFTPVAEMSAVHHMLLYGCVEPGRLDRGEIWNCGSMHSSSSERVGYNGKRVRDGPICSVGESRILYAWAKNAPSLTLPKDVAFQIGGDSGISSLVLQFHYGDHNNMPNTLEMTDDQIGVVLQVTSVPQINLAGVYLLVTGGMIPPRSTAKLETACEMETDKVIYPFAFRTHSHTLGRVISGYRARRNHDGVYDWTLIGKKDPQLPQMFYPVETPMMVEPGDVLAARCTMVSNRSTTTYIGATQNDEMCNFYMMYYVTDGSLLESSTCFSYTPENYWEEGYLELNNIPEDASSL